MKVEEGKIIAAEL
jgi:hypothetical protein